MFKFATTAALLAAVAIATPAGAAYVIDVRQVGTDVVLTGSGSINLSGLTSWGRSNAGGFVYSNVANIGAGIFGATNGYSGVTGPQSIGTGTSFNYANVNAGKAVGIGATSNMNAVVFVPTDYVSGTALGTSTSTFSANSFAGLGLTEGTYVYRLGSAVDADTFTVNIGSAVAAVPEPATWALMLVGFGAVGTALRRRRQPRTVLA